ncbi:MAG: DNA-binding response regulator [Candidatus Liptonbacteria bacterium RIFCSPHIGHO2_01_FULL_57_28]|uniref:DNA-binding response regulator n=1 Tax=Candidatus Liptonbacteria bacterium RIFCSPHIGHO2_01_FULL_57_28 TaxID=1798647 RepID=A0A1G2CBF3_9BACT|nr:MAG: DNA-binding response regulator [Candidatus Liptonbacteria bacterium RIFCSPHIGHO2_01_FULL_57_28]
MRVLVVEDEKKIGAFLKAGLSEKCYSVDLAADGERGSFLARTTEYDLIILDNILPKKTGLEICRDLRERGKAMPILMLSVKSDTATKVELLNAGADDYLCKPFSLDELLARISALLRRPAGWESDVMQLGDLRLDALNHSVKRGKQRLYLTRKEFMLLEYLLRHAGTVLSRAMILEHVWDMDGDPFSNTIESHISSLRKKVDPPGQKKLIHTLPGRGYKIDLSKI